MAKPKLKKVPFTAEFLREHVHYDPETGVLTHKTKLHHNTVVGSVMGFTAHSGYRYVTFLGKTYSAQHLIWYHEYGVWPTEQIHFADGDITNLRLSNLREPENLYRDDPAAYQRRRMRNNRPAYHRAQLRKYFGLTLEQYNEMLIAQDGVCAICKNPETMRLGRDGIRPLSVDHNHTTLEIRDLLCQSCNLGIGSMKEDPARLRAAAEYLERHAEPKPNAKVIPMRKDYRRKENRHERFSHKTEKG